MIYDLRWFRFTVNSDRVIGQHIQITRPLDALAGDDSIIGKGSPVRIFRDQTAQLGPGHDLIQGAEGVLVEGQILTVDGNDTVTADRWRLRILAGGSIEMGPGQDRLTGQIDNYGTIDTGEGKDQIEGVDGLKNNRPGLINSGSGHDSVSGTGSIFGVRNDGTLRLDRGNDQLIGSSNGEAEGLRNRD